MCLVSYGNFCSFALFIQPEVSFIKTLRDLGVSYLIKIIVSSLTYTTKSPGSRKIIAGNVIHVELFMLNFD